MLLHVLLYLGKSGVTRSCAAAGSLMVLLYLLEAMRHKPQAQSPSDDSELPVP